mmetsp:Transcript_8707/g.19011  ORF Transcript_8707/g.19011 Transcript_8707/m.19011 type:complete len:321 (+) Transcript_8707:674-1636(+)
MLERRTGMTMHGDRQGANSVLRTAPSCLLKAFEAAREDSDSGIAVFFREAFDRHADPCLEGRVGRLMDYLQMKSKGLAEGLPPPEDFAIELPTANEPSCEAVVGEYLRVFTNSCVWRWALQEGLDYQKAKLERQKEINAEKFTGICNTATFQVDLLAQNAILDEPSKQWEVEIEPGKWSAFPAQANEALERARLLSQSLCQVKVGHWDYEVDLRHMVQINMHTKKERPVHFVERNRDCGATAPGKLSLADVKAALRVFEELETLAPAPSPTRGGLKLMLNSRSTAAVTAPGEPGEASPPMPVTILPGGVSTSGGGIVPTP